LDILFRERWYRIPMAHMPSRRFKYLAFYQPATFGWGGKCIRYYARVRERDVKRRNILLPDEARHPRAHDDYARLRVGAVRELARPIRNILPRRVTFGFTTLRRLRTAKNVLQLYGVPETEEIVGNALRAAGIRAIPQRHVTGKDVEGRKKRYRLDFAIFCVDGKIAIECDNRKAHAGARQRERDKVKDAFLRRHGWKVIRLAEKEIVANAGKCIAPIQRAIRGLGGCAR
jgi:hypothetical protein